MQPPRRRSPVSLVWMAAVVCGVGLLWAAAPAAAHLGIESSDPANAAEIAAAPEAATLTFTADVDLATAEARLRRLGPPDTPLSEATNRDVPTDALERLETSGRTVVFDLPDLAPGMYAIDWAVNEQGGHANTSFILFRVTGDGRGGPISGSGLPAWAVQAVVGCLVFTTATVVLSVVKRRGGVR